MGQDPYPFPDSKKNPHAHGLAFSSVSIETPASLRTILREVDRDVVKTDTKKQFNEAFVNNDLSLWAKQGVLLLNTALTVRAGDPGSHKELWQGLMKDVLKLLYESEERKVFVLWGKEARDIFWTVFSDDPDRLRPMRHSILIAGHPATASKGRDLFSGCNHFSKINLQLERWGDKPIKWTLTNTK